MTLMGLVEVLLAWSPAQQVAGIVLSTLGVLCSLWLARDAWLEMRSVAQNGAVEQLIARVHLRTQIVVLMVQLSFGVISALVFWLPEVPATMGAPIHGPYTVFVISTRRLLRLGMIVLLAGAALRQAQDRRRIFALLETRGRSEGTP